MAEIVQSNLESMIPELRQLQKRNIFSEIEIKAIIKKRTDFEYALKKRIADKSDYLKYIEYEMNLESLRVRRVSNMKLKKKHSLSDHAGIQRIHILFDRATRKFGDDLKLWLDYIQFAIRAKSTKSLGKIFARALQLHPKSEELWIRLSNWEWSHNASSVAARNLMQRALDINPESKVLWREYMRLELMFLIKLSERKSIMANVDGSTQDGEFWNGKVVEIVYQSACKAIPSDMDFRLDLLKMVLETTKGFESISSVAKRIFEIITISIETDFSHDYVALRQVEYIKCHALYQSSPEAVMQSLDRLLDLLDRSEGEAKKQALTEIGNFLKDLMKTTGDGALYDGLVLTMQKLLNLSREGSFLSEDFLVLCLKKAKLDKSEKLKLIDEHKSTCLSVGFWKTALKTDGKYEQELLNLLRTRHSALDWESLLTLLLEKSTIDSEEILRFAFDLISRNPESTIHADVVNKYVTFLQQSPDESKYAQIQKRIEQFQHPLCCYSNLIPSLEDSGSSPHSVVRAIYRKALEYYSFDAGLWRKILTFELQVAKDLAKYRNIINRLQSESAVDSDIKQQILAAILS